MSHHAAQRMAWLLALPLIVACSGHTSSNPSAANTNGTLTVNWVAPTKNADGSAATDLTGFTLYYGLGPRAYNTRLSIDDPSATKAVIHGLRPGADYYFAVAAHNAQGRQSVLSPEVHGKARAE